MAIDVNRTILLLKPAGKKPPELPVGAGIPWPMDVPFVLWFQLSLDTLFFLYNTASMSKFSSSQVTGSWHKELPFFCCRNSSYVIFICNDSISKQNFILRYWWLEYYCNFSGDTKSQPEHMHWATLLPFHRILQLWAVSLPPVPSSASTWFVTKQCCSEREACWLVVLHQAILRNE